MTATAYDLIIIGAGAAGLMAAAEAGRLGLNVLVLEGQREPGLKLLITGGGRCNATHARVTAKDFHAGNAHTLRHVLQTFSPHDAVAFFEAWGAPLAVQPSGEFFAADDKASTVRDALVRAARHYGAVIECGRRVISLTAEGAGFNVVGHDFLRTGRKVLVTTGGLSYPATGSDGSGYVFAGNFGHRLVPAHPALVALFAGDDSFATLGGITSPVRLSLWGGGKKLLSVEGPFLFTHQGFSGPAAMEMAGPWLKAMAQGPVEIRADFLPAVKGEDISTVIIPGNRRSIKNILTAYLPERLVIVLAQLAKVDPLRPSGELRVDERRALQRSLRACPLPVGDTAGYAKAEVTAGGVDLEELKGATLESRLQEGLYFAGEVLDVDGRIGGFNLQWAWSSAIAAARAVARNISK